MFSYEIDSLMRSKGYRIEKDDYANIISDSTQIERVNYCAFTNKFHIWTNDGYNWEFNVVND